MGLLNAWLGLGVEPKNLTFLQISLRGVIVFIATLVMLRLADRRFLAKLSAFDAILGLILASMLARAVNGSATFFPTLGAGFIIVGLHRLLARLAFIWEPFAKLIKGNAKLLILHGTRETKTLRGSRVSENDLLEEVRIIGQRTKVEEVELAMLERDGEISVIPKETRHR
jgi:uncharacterized membrane protein YcaP (DUF421 family)